MDEVQRNRMCQKMFERPLLTLVTVETKVWEHDNLQKVHLEKMTKRDVSNNVRRISEELERRSGV